MKRWFGCGVGVWQSLLWLVLALSVGWPLSAAAQSAPAGEVDRSKLSDSERARRDADRVFNFIKFHAVKPAAAPAAAPAAPRPVAAARPAPVAAAAVAAAAAPAAQALQQAAVAALPAPPAAAAASDPRTLPPAVPDPIPAAVAQPEPVVPAAPEVAPAEDEDVGLKMTKYVAPELNAKAIASVTTSTAKVRVRFMVMPDGSVGKATASAGVPRALASVATRAVEQWRFEPIKEAREVEVEVDFKFD